MAKMRIKAINPAWIIDHKAIESACSAEGGEQLKQLCWQTAVPRQDLPLSLDDALHASQCLLKSGNFSWARGAVQTELTCAGKLLQDLKDGVPVQTMSACAP